MSEALKHVTAIKHKLTEQLLSLYLKGNSTQ